MFQCDDIRDYIIQFWPSDDEDMCSKHVEAWNKLIIKFSASRWLILRNILRCTVSKTLKYNCMFLIRCYILSSKNYMFRPVVAIIRFYHSTHLRLFYTIRVAACLVGRSQHQNPSNLITVQQDATYSVYYISVGSCTCFGCWQSSSGARTTVITASGID